MFPEFVGVQVWGEGDELRNQLFCFNSVRLVKGFDGGIESFTGCSGFHLIWSIWNCGRWGRNARQQNQFASWGLALQSNICKLCKISENPWFYAGLRALDFRDFRQLRGRDSLQGDSAVAFHAPGKRFLALDPLPLNPTHLRLREPLLKPL